MSPRKTYHDQTDEENILKLREVLKTLPYFARDYFRAIDATTTTRTRISYAYDIRLFFHFLITQNPSLEGMRIPDLPIEILDEVKALDLEEYMEYLKLYEDSEDKHITNGESGLQSKISALRRFYAYYYRKEMIHTNPTGLIDMPKIHEKAIIRLDADEVASLLDYVESCGNNLTGQQKAYYEKTKERDLAIVTLVLGTVIRGSE